MVRAVFIGSHNRFNQVLVHWLSERVDLRAVAWTNSTKWRLSWKGRLAFTRKRWRRYGLLKTVDETLFYLFYYAFLNRRSEAELRTCVLERYWAANGVCEWSGPALFTDNVNSREAFDFLASHRPDVAMAVCINQYFGKRLRGLFRHGVLLWHEGFTPEYKGLYPAFWAVHNLDFEHIGYTFLRMNDQYDAGEVLAQGRASDIDPLRHTHDFMGHKAIWDGLPDVERVLGELNHGRLTPIDRSQAQPHSYTYPGISDFIRQRLRLRRSS